MGQKHKNAICDRTTPHLHIKSSLYMCRRVQGTELNYLYSFKSYCNSSDFGFLGSGGWSRWVGGCLGWSAIVHMSSGMFIGKESSNRIELSRLVQDLLNFDVSGSLWLWGGGWRVVGGAPHTHIHTHACMHTHAHMVNMIISCKYKLGESLGIPYDVICTCACMCTCVGGTLSPPPTHITHPPGGTPRSSQNSIALELIEIFQFRLKI